MSAPSSTSSTLASRLAAENNYLKAKLERNQAISHIARDRAARMQELEAEIQELMGRSSVADLDSAIGRLRAAHKAEIEKLAKEKNEEVEKLEVGWKKVVKGLQVEITRLEGEVRNAEKEKGDGGKIAELREELHEGGAGDKLSGTGYQHVEHKVHFKVKKQIEEETERRQEENKKREEAEARLKEAEVSLKEALDEIRDLKGRLGTNKVMSRGPASNSPGMIREVVREAVDGIRGRRRGLRE